MEDIRCTFVTHINKNQYFSSRIYVSIVVYKVGSVIVFFIIKKNISRSVAHDSELSRYQGTFNHTFCGHQLVYTISENVYTNHC